MPIPNKLGERTLLEDIAVIRTLLVMDHVKATSDAGQSIPNDTWTTVIFEDEEYDTNSEYAAATGIFTAKRSGHLHVTAAIAYSASTAWGATEANRLAIYVNGVRTQIIDYLTDFSGANIVVKSAGSATVQLAIGDTVTVRAHQDSGVAQTLFATSGQHTYACFNWLF